MSTLAESRAKSPERHQDYPVSLDDLAQALDYSEEGFALTDPDGNYVYINRAHLHMYGYEQPQELLGRSWRLLYTPEWVRHFEESVLPIIPRDKVWRGQVLSRRRDGSSFLASVTLTYLPDGKITCNCRDESVAPHGDSRSALHELGERLIAGLPARLRRPLDLLAGYSSLFLAELEAGRQPAADSLRAGLEEIDATGQRLAEQIKRLELVAELAAAGDLGEETHDGPLPSDWRDRIASACRARAEKAGRDADLVVDLAPGNPAAGYRPLEGIVLELVSNALQSSRAGDAIKVSGQPGANVYILRVCDEGVGLPPDGLQPGDNRPFGQTEPRGFGLAVVQYILRRLGGSLTRETDGSCDTCLRVTLPRRD